MNNNWIEHPSLKNMDQRKKQVLSTLMTESQGKPMQQCLPFLIKANQSLQAQGLNFTSEESSAIMQLLTQDMSPQDISRMEMMRNMINNMGGAGGNSSSKKSSSGRGGMNPSAMMNMMNAMSGNGGGQSQNIQNRNNQNRMNRMNMNNNKRNKSK